MTTTSGRLPLPPMAPTSSGEFPARAPMQSPLIYTVAPPEMRGRLFGVLVICIGSGLIGFTNIGLMGEWFGGSTAMRIVAAEGLIPLLLIGYGWRELWSRDTYDRGTR